MRIGSVELKGGNKDYIVFPRPEGDVVIWAQTVRDFKEFEALVKYPIAPVIQTKEGKKSDTKDPSYRDLVKIYDDQRFAYLCIKSLEPSDIEWNEVNLDNPRTYVKWIEELLEAGLSEVECNRIIGLVLQVNSLDEAKLQAAREHFARGQGQAASESSGQSTEPQST